MSARPRSSVFVLVLAFACAGDDGSEPGTELGPCVQERYCEQPLVCTDGICVHPGHLDDDGQVRIDMGGGTWPGDDGNAEGGSVEGGSAEGGGAEVYCTNDSASGGCICGHTADYGPLDEPCSESTLPSPSQCCAGEGWPSYGGCSCWSLSCRRISYDTCHCGIGLPDGEDEPVGACTPDGGICCRDGSSSCACWTSLTSCPPDYQQVETCTVAELACGDSTRVTACN
jgi:hypothetical protein